MATSPQNISADLLAAQKHLLRLRDTSKSRQNDNSAKIDSSSYGRNPEHIPPFPTHLPPHLGWESQAITAVFRSYKDSQPKTTLSPNVKSAQHWQDHKEGRSGTDRSSESNESKQTVKIFPDLAIAMLQHHLAASGRIWLLLRFLDNLGKGWFAEAEIRGKLTGKDAPYRVCGWRQLRNLLNQGSAIFWEWQNGRVWLKSPQKVAQNLSVCHLSQPPVALPVSALISGIGQVRAHFYATFHSSRTPQKTNDTFQTHSAPIARSTIAQLTHVQIRTQRRYDKVARVQARRNIAIISKTSPSQWEEANWQYGRATFQIQDKKGKVGKKGQTYIACQLPNSYSGPHHKLPNGQQKRINKALSDLLMQGITGNGQSRFEKRYYNHGRDAATVYNRGTSQEIYWYDGQARIWHQLNANVPLSDSRKK